MEDRHSDIHRESREEGLDEDSAESEGVVEIESAAEEEGREPKVRTRIKGPTKKEREEHEATHIPFRVWCRHCVRGRGRNSHHKKAEGEDKDVGEQRVPKISMDYHFMSKDDESAQKNPILTMVDEKTGAVYARAVGHKGIGDNNERQWVIESIVDELETWGYRGEEIIMKVDQEKAITAVRRAVSELRAGKTIPESPPKGESAANGRIEEAGKRIREYVRTLVDQIEYNAKMSVKSEDVIMQWAVRWAAMLINRYVVREDGKTTHERIKGRKCKDVVLPFGESIWYKQLKTSKTADKKAECDWKEGVWLGQCQRSNEMLVGTAAGVVRAWALKRKVDEERWNAEEIANMKGTPQQPVPGKVGTYIPITVRIDREDDVEPLEVQAPRQEDAPRRMQLRKRHFEKHEYTEGCEGCRRRKSGMGQRPHTRECRRRMEEAMKTGDEKDKQWVERARQREDDFLAEHGPKDVPEVVEMNAEEPDQGAEESRREEPQGQEEDGRERRKAEDEGEDEGEERRKAKKQRKEERRKHRDEKRKRKEQGDKMEDETEDRTKKKGKQTLDGEEYDQVGGSASSGDVQEKTDTQESPETRMSGVESTVEDDEGEQKMLMKIMSQVIRGVDISEIYSPERIAAEARKFGLIAGLSMDLLTGWDFEKKEDRSKAEEHQEKEKPLLLVGSPMCTMFSKLQRLSAWTDEKEEKLMKSIRHIQWCCEMYRRQMQDGRVFLHEHPEGATSWQLPCMKRLMKTEGVFRVVVDQCMFGQTVKDRRGKVEGLARKKTVFLTNSWWIALELARRCDGSHEHIHLMGGRAAQTAKYPPELCRAVCRGLMKEKSDRTMGIRAISITDTVKRGTQVPDTNEHHDEKEAMQERENVKAMSESEAWDDVSGVKLDPVKVKEARREEIGYFKKKGVYVKITRKEAQEKGYKIVKVRWIDINKGDEKHPVYRSRLVAKEFKDDNGQDDNLFAGTPPLEALKMIMSDAATSRAGRTGVRSVLIADVSRAFFEAKARRKLCVELVDEDKTEDDKAEDKVGLLELSMYGTRDAATNWQEEVAKEMRGWGFRRGRYNPCMYWHRERGIKVLIHGDDFVATETREQLEWLKGKLSKRFEIKATMVGGGIDEEKEGRVLNRIIRRTEQGWEYEADQRHAEILVEALKLKGANSVTTPGEEEKEWEVEENGQELSGEDATRFRALAARANYLALDRPDIQFPVKEVCRGMAKPTVGHMKKLKRIGRYLVGRPRVVTKYEWRGEEREVEVYGDSNWAGCKTTGKSTSGGVAMIGGQVLKSWSHTQKTVALSSAEAELTALVKATCEGIGIAAMWADWGIPMRVIVFADANAALGIVKRKGAGKLRHVNIGMLWVQDKMANEEIDYRKVDGAFNPGDLMTKNNAIKILDDHMKIMKMEFKTGRAEKSSELSRGINSFILLQRFIVV